MFFFITYVIFSLNKLKLLIDTRGAGKLITPWIILWFLILTGIIVNYIPGYENIYRSVLQRMLIFLGFFLITFNEIRKNKVLKEKIDAGIIFSILIMAFFYFTGIGVDFSGGRLILFGSNSNTVGVWCVIGIIFSVDRLVQGKYRKLNIWYYALIVFLGFIILVMTGSRKSIIMLFVSVFSYYFFLKTNPRFKLKLTVPFIVASIFAINFISESPIFIERTELELERRDFGGRLPIWEESLLVIKENPIIGAGPGLIREELSQSLGISRSIHNEFITIAVLAGLPGLFVFSYFLWVIYRMSFKRLRKQNIKFSTLPISLFFILIIFLATAGGAINSFITWFLFAYIAGTTENPKEKFITSKFVLKNSTTAPP